MKSSLHCSPPQKETKPIRASTSNLLHTVLDQEISIGANARTSTGGALWKKTFFKISRNSEETPVPEKTPVNFATFVRTPFLQNNSGRLLLKYEHCKNEAREIDCLCCTEVDAILFASVIIPEREGSMSPSSFYRHLPNYQLHVLALSTWQMSSSFGSWCS